jgi:hypothetical protein
MGQEGGKMVQQIVRKEIKAGNRKRKTNHRFFGRRLVALVSFAF